MSEISSSNINGGLIINTGVSCVGKTVVARTAAQVATEHGVPSVVVTTGVPFRLTSRMIIERGFEGQIQDWHKANQPNLIAEAILPIIALTNWSADAEGMSLTYNGTNVDDSDEVALMSDPVSTLIPCFSGIDAVRFGLFDTNSGLIGKLMLDAIEQGKLAIVDTRFAPGEISHTVLQALHNQSRLGIARIVPKDDAAWLKLAANRARLIHGPNVTNDQITAVMAKIARRTNDDIANGVKFPQEYVEQHFAGSYTTLVNDANGLERLREAVSIFVKPIVEAVVGKRKKIAA